MNSSDLLCFKPFSRTRRRNLCNPDRMAREEEHQRERVWEDFACLFSTAQDIGETGYDFQAASPPMMIYFLSRSPLLPSPLFLPPPSVSHNISPRSRMSAACDIKLQLRMPPSPSRRRRGVRCFRIRIIRARVGALPDSGRERRSVDRHRQVVVARLAYSIDRSVPS